MFQEQWEAEVDEIRAFIGSASVDGLKAAAKRIEEAITRHGAGIPVRTKVMPDAWYARLDTGIQFPVRVIHAAGIETGQSCEGGIGHAYHEPAIDLASGGSAHGFKALAALVDYGIEVQDVSLFWGVIDGLPTERMWRITLRRACPERAEDRPIFVHGYAPPQMATVSPATDGENEKWDTVKHQFRAFLGRARAEGHAEGVEDVFSAAVVDRVRAERIGAAWQLLAMSRIQPAQTSVAAAMSGDIDMAALRADELQAEAELRELGVDPFTGRSIQKN